MAKLVDRLLSAAALVAAIVYGLALVPAAGLDAASGFPLAFGAISKLVALWVAAAGAALACRALARDDPGTSGWRLLSLGFAGFGAAQLVLAYHQLVLAIPIPFPSIADVLFLAASLLLFLGLLAFLSAYVRAGFPFAWKRDFAIAGAFAALAGALCGWLLLGPLLPIEAWNVETVLTLLYPIADLVLLVPAILILRVIVRFRGLVSLPWIYLVLGIFLFLVADVLFAHLVHLGADRLEPVVDLLYVFSYLVLAKSALAQRRLVA